MKAHVAGHVYDLQVYSPSGEPCHPFVEQTTFVKKVGEKFPGNVPPELIGTNCQEVIRMLIDRILYLQSQRPCRENEFIIANQRNSLTLFEQRAAQLKGQTFFIEASRDLPIETIVPCARCGHIFPHSHTDGEAGAGA